MPASLPVVPARARLVRLGALIAALLVSAIPLRAQEAGTGTLVGTVVDAVTGEVLGAVQVGVRPQGDTTRVGTLTNSSGRFLVPGLSPGEYEVTFSRIGYAPVSEAIEVEAGVEGSIDLGTVEMTPSAVVLEEINVVAAQPPVVHAPDRDIYAADAIPGAAGGVATDVLQGIPDLEVSIDGGITMHGESPAIYINGREAPMSGESLALFLEQFAAENIERVEVIPNPSARYQAEGAGGIVNIVLKEDVGLGISGNAFVNAGTRGQLGAGGRGTYQRGPLTLNGGTSLRLSGDERTTAQLRRNLLADPVTLLRQEGWSDRSRWAGNLDLSAAYEVSDATEVIGEARLHRTVSDAERIIQYTEMDVEENVLDEYDRVSFDDGSGFSTDLALELRHEFGRDGEEGGAGERRGPPRGRGGAPGGDADELRVELEYERGIDREESLVERRLLEDAGVVDPARELTLDDERETESEIELGFDYTRGLGAAMEMEVGYEGEFGWTDEARLLEVRLDGPTSEPVSREDRGFLHRQTVHGAYFTLARSFGDLGAQVGARAEHARNRLELPAGGGVHGRDYFSVFPSANLNYSFDGGKRLRLSYSMRVRRPSSNVLNPINTSNDPLDRRVGNPGIEPQYTHSYMLNASWSGAIGYLRASPFIRRSVNEWEQIRTVDEDGVATTTYENVGSTSSYGVSLTGSVRDFHGIGARVSLNGRHVVRDYSAVVERPTPSTTRWSLRTNLDGEITDGLSAQGSIVYNPPRDLPQGRASSTLMTRLGLRYRFLERRASLNLNVTDPLDIYDSSIQRSDRGYIETESERVSMRRLTMSLSYSFQGGGGGGGDRRRRGR